MNYSELLVSFTDDYQMFFVLPLWRDAPKPFRRDEVIVLKVPPVRKAGAPHDTLVVDPFVDDQERAAKDSSRGVGVI